MRSSPPSSNRDTTRSAVAMARRVELGDQAMATTLLGPSAACVTERTWRSCIGEGAYRCWARRGREGRAGGPPEGFGAQQREACRRVPQIRGEVWGGVLAARAEPCVCVCDKTGAAKNFYLRFFLAPCRPPATCNKSKHPSARTMRLFALGLVVSAPRCPSALQTRCPSAWSPPPLIPSNPPKPFTRPPYPHPSSPALRRSPSRPSTTRPTRTLPAPRPQRRPSCTRSAPVTRARSTTASRTPRARWLPTRAPTTTTRARSTTAARSSSRACARRRAPRRRARPSC